MIAVVKTAMIAEHGVELRVEDVLLPTDAEYHQLGQATGVHPDATAAALEQGNTASPGPGGGADELAGARHDDHGEHGCQAGEAQPADVDLETGSDEEDGQEDQDAHGLDAFPHLVEQLVAVLTGDRRSEQEGPEDLMDADLGRDERRGQHPDDEGGEDVRRQPAQSPVPGDDTSHERSNHAERHGDERG